MSKLEIGQPGVCVYCGDIADSIDHLIPISSSKFSGRPRHGKMKMTAGPIANACRDCNTHLSDRWFDTLWERMEWAHLRLEKQAKAVLWSQREVKKLDYTLQSYVDKKRREGLWIRQRADWFGSREFFLNLEPLVWKVKKNKKLQFMFQSTVDKTKWELYLRKME